MLLGKVEVKAESFLRDVFMPVRGFIFFVKVRALKKDSCAGFVITVFNGGGRGRRGLLLLRIGAGCKLSGRIGGIINGIRLRLRGIRLIKHRLRIIAGDGISHWRLCDVGGDGRFA